MTFKTFLLRLRAVPGQVRDRCRPFGKPLAVMTGVYALGISAILRANFYYIDDLNRTYYGYQGWGNFSRYLSNFLSNFIHADSYLTDVSPLPQLLACLLLAAASVIVLYLVTGRDRFTFWEYAAVLPLGLSPYMLVCLSFKFDAPYMAVSVLASVAPLLAAKKDPPGAWPLAACCFLGTLVMCLTYQAASGILPMLTVLLTVRMWLQGRRFRDSAAFAGAAAAGYCAAIVLYKVFFVHAAPSSYIGAVDTSLLPVGQLLPHAAEVLRSYFGLILSQYDRKWLILAGLVCLGYVWVSVRDAARNKVLSLVLSLLCAAAIALLSFGLYPLLAMPLIQARSMYGSGAALAFLAVSAAAGKRALPGKAACLALSWCFFVFAFTYGNALFVQRTYTEFRIEELIGSLNDLDSENLTAGSPAVVMLRGDIGYAPALQRSVENFPMLQALVPSTFGSQNWNSFGFQFYYGLPEMTIANAEETQDMRPVLPLLEQTPYHDIYGNEHLLYIDLK